MIRKESPCRARGLSLSASPRFKEEGSCRRWAKSRLRQRYERTTTASRRVTVILRSHLISRTWPGFFRVVRPQPQRMRGLRNGDESAVIALYRRPGSSGILQKHLHSRSPWPLGVCSLSTEFANPDTSRSTILLQRATTEPDRKTEMSPSSPFPINANHSGRFHKAYDVAPGVLMVSFDRSVGEISSCDLS